MRKQASLFLFLRLYWHYVSSDHGPNQATEKAENARPHSFLHTFRVCRTPPPSMQPAPLHRQRAAYVSRRIRLHNHNHSPSLKSRELQFRQSPRTVRVTKSNLPQVPPSSTNSARNARKTCLRADKADIFMKEFRKIPPLSGTIFLDNASICPAKCARMKAIRVKFWFDKDAPRSHDCANARRLF